MQKAAFYIAWVVFVSLPISILGQVVSPLGRFQVDYAKGCAPLTVTLTDITGGPTAQYLYDADTCVVGSPKYTPSLCPPTNTTTNTTYTYTQPGTYSLVQVVASQIPRGDTITIEVLPSQPPEFDLKLCNNYGVNIRVIDTYYEQFEIDYGDGSGLTNATTHTYPPGTASYAVSITGYFNNGPANCQTTTTMITPVNTIPVATIDQVTVLNQGPNSGQIQVDYQLANPDVRYILQKSVNGTASFKNIEIPSGTTHTVFNLNTIDSIHCFRIVARDRCTNTESYSNTVCSTNIQVNAQNGQNQINWSTINTAFSRYEVEKDGLPLGPPITIDNITGTIDAPTICEQLSCYRVTTVNTDGSRSVSVDRCVIGINTLPPPPVASLTASVDGSNIVIDWQSAVPLNFYRIFRSENNGPFEALGQGTSFPFTDVNLRPQFNTYCYYIIYQNACGIQSEPSVVACAMQLTGTNQNNQNFALNWTPYQGYGSGILEYQLEIMDENGVLVGAPIGLGPNATNYLDPITQNRQISQYRIVALSNDSIPLRSFSNIIKVDIPLQLFIPNSFTPNNDGLNDTFQAKGLFIDQYSMEIYNQWGELVFHTAELEQGWDGVYKGTLSPEDTYVYRIQATDTKGRVSVKNGTLHLLRLEN
jgi:gliding motility-associated-like protein